MRLRGSCGYPVLVTAIIAVTLLAGHGDLNQRLGDDITLATNREVNDLTGFTSPSGNVGCYIDLSSVRCDVRERSWAPPPKPADCPDYTDFGQGITLQADGGAAFVCAGDTALSSGPALQYGDSISAGSLSCESSSADMTCRDVRTLHGFSIAREAYRLF